MNKLTIIIPFYETDPTWVVQAFESIVKSACNATETLFRVVVVDDGSSSSLPTFDFSRAVNVSVNVIKHEYNRGLGAARNSGIDVAEQDSWIVFLDSDDLLLGLPSLKEDSILVGRSLLFYGDDKVSLAPKMECLKQIDLKNINDLLFLRNPHPVSAYFVKRQHIGELRFNPALKSCEDWDFWIRLSTNCIDMGVQFWMSSNFVTGIRKHGASMSSSAERIFVSRSQLFKDLLTSRDSLTGLKLIAAKINAALGDVIFMKTGVYPRMNLAANSLKLLAYSCFSRRVFIDSIVLSIFGILAASSPQVARKKLFRRFELRSRAR